MAGLVVMFGGWPILADPPFGIDGDDQDAEKRWKLCLIYGHIPSEPCPNCGDKWCVRCKVGL